MRELCESAHKHDPQDTCDRGCVQGAHMEIKKIKNKTLTATRARAMYKLGHTLLNILSVGWGCCAKQNGF